MRKDVAHVVIQFGKDRRVVLGNEPDTDSLRVVILFIRKKLCDNSTFEFDLFL